MFALSTSVVITVYTCVLSLGTYTRISDANIIYNIAELYYTRDVFVFGSICVRACVDISSDEVGKQICGYAKKPR